MNFLCLGSVFILWQTDMGSWVNYLIKLAGCVFFAVGLGELKSLCIIQHSALGFESGVSCGRLGLGSFLKLDITGDAAKKALKVQDNWAAARVSLVDMLFTNDLICTAVCGLSAAWFAAAGAVKISGAVTNITAVLLGAVSAYLTLRIFESTLSFILLNEKTMMFETDIGGITSKNRKMHFCDDVSQVHRIRAAFNKIKLCTAAGFVCDAVNRLSHAELVQTYFGFISFIVKLTLLIFIAVTAYNFNKLRLDSNRKSDSEFNA